MHEHRWRAGLLQRLVLHLRRHRRLVAAAVAAVVVATAGAVWWTQRDRDSSGVAVAVQFDGDEASVGLFDDPIDEASGTEQSVPVQLDRQCLELRMGDRVPMRNCTSPYADGPLRIGGAALFEDGSAPSMMMVVLLIDEPIATVELTTSDGTGSSPTSLLPDNRGAVAVVRARCNRADACDPTLRLDGTDGTFGYTIRVGDGRFPLGEFVPAG